MPKSRKDRPSSTPGKVKGQNCQKSETKTRYSRDSRWYRTDPENYRKACAVINQEKGNSKSVWVGDIAPSMAQVAAANEQGVEPGWANVEPQVTKVLGEIYKEEI